MRLQNAVSALGTCNLSLGASCEVLASAGAGAIEVSVVVDGARTGVRVASVAARTPVGALPEPPPALTGVAPYAGTLPARGIALTVWQGGAVALLEAEPAIASVFVSRNGAMYGYVVGAPAFVNAAFLDEVGDSIASGTPVMIVVR